MHNLRRSLSAALLLSLLLSSIAMADGQPAIKRKLLNMGGSDQRMQRLIDRVNEIDPTDVAPNSESVLTCLEYINASTVGKGYMLSEDQLHCQVGQLAKVEFDKLSEDTKIAVINRCLSARILNPNPRCDALNQLYVDILKSVARSHRTLDNAAQNALRYVRNEYTRYFNFPIAILASEALLAGETASYPDSVSDNTAYVFERFKNGELAIASKQIHILLQSKSITDGEKCKLYIYLFRILAKENPTEIQQLIADPAIRRLFLNKNQAVNCSKLVMILSAANLSGEALRFAQQALPFFSSREKSGKDNEKDNTLSVETNLKIWTASLVRHGKSKEAVALYDACLREDPQLKLLGKLVPQRKDSPESPNTVPAMAPEIDELFLDEESPAGLDAFETMLSYSNPPIEDEISLAQNRLSAAQVGVSRLLCEDAIRRIVIAPDDVSAALKTYLQLRLKHAFLAEVLKSAKSMVEIMKTGYYRADLPQSSLLLVPAAIGPFGPENNVDDTTDFLKSEIAIGERMNPKSPYLVWLYARCNVPAKTGHRFPENTDFQKRRKALVDDPTLKTAVETALHFSKFDPDPRSLGSSGSPSVQNTPESSVNLWSEEWQRRMNGNLNAVNERARNQQTLTNQERLRVLSENGKELTGDYLGGLLLLMLQNSQTNPGLFSQLADVYPKCDPVQQTSCMPLAIIVISMSPRLDRATRKMVLQSIIDNNPPGIAHDAGLQGTFKQWLNRIRSDEELRTLCERAAACDGTPESQKFGAELLKLGDDAEADTGRRLEQTCRALAVQYKSLSPVAQQRFSSKMAEVSIQLISHNPKSAGNELALVAGEFAKQHGMVIPKLMDVEGALIKAQRLNDALQILKLYDDVLSSKPAGLVKVDAQRAKDELTKLQKLMGH